MAYNNVNKRIVNLAEDGLLEEMKLGESVHGRKDFKLTSKGLEYLTPHIITHPESIQTVVKYMDKLGMDKTIFRKLLNDRFRDTLSFINFFLRTIKNNPELAATYSVKAADQLKLVQEGIGSLLEFEKIGKVPKATKSRKKASID